MGFILSAGVPTSMIGTAYTVAGTANVTTTLANYVKEFNITGAAENYAAKLNNTKYDQDGGSIGFNDDVDLVIADTRKINYFFRGCLWKDVKAVFATEGCSSTKTLTATIASMRIESMNCANDNGRMMMNAKARMLSVDGTTVPIGWVHT